MDQKQGLGRKVYTNGDIYEGLWSQVFCQTVCACPH